MSISIPSSPSLAGSLLARIKNDELTIYSATKRKRDKGREQLKNNETVCCETAYDQLSVSPRKKLRYINNKQELETEEIQNHIDEKIHRFVLTLIQVRNQPFHFSIGKTHAQGKSAGKIRFKDDNTNKVYCETLQAVHSSAIPVLYAQDRDAYENWQSETGPEPEKFIFIAKSSSDHHQNATRNLPIQFNVVDRILEGGTKNAKLRIKALKIINECAKGNISLENGLGKFLSKYKKIIQEKIDLLETTPNPSTKVLEQTRICKIFLTCVINHERADYKEYVDKVLNLPQIQDCNEEEREVVCELKCGLIQRQNGVQSFLSHNILSPLKGQALGTKRKRSPHNFKAAMMQYILKKSASLKAKRVLLQQFNVSEEQLKASGDCAKAYEFLKKKNSDVSEFIRIAEQKYDHLQKLKNAYRVDLIQFFMKKVGLNQDEVFGLYNYKDVTTLEEIKMMLSGTTTLTYKHLQIFAEILSMDIAFFEIEEYEKESVV